MWKYVEMCDNLHNSFLNWTRYFLSIPQNANESSKSMLAVPRWATGCCTLLSITHNTDKSWHTAGRYTHEKKLQLYKLFLLFKILPVLFHNDFLELKKKKNANKQKQKIKVMACYMPVQMYQWKSKHKVHIFCLVAPFPQVLFLFFFFKSALGDYILKARTFNTKSGEILTKQQKHVSIIPISSGDVRSFILMVPSLENKERNKF